MKDKANKGWIKEFSKPKKQEAKKPFAYSKEVTKSNKPNSAGTIHRAREFKSAKPTADTNFASEQVSAKESHKGNK